MRYKLPARRSLGIDLDGAVTARASNLARLGRWFVPGVPGSIAAAVGTAGVEFVNRDGIGWLERCDLSASAVVYCDPPYVMSSRRQHRPLYRYELTDADHVRFLRAVRRLRCRVLISGYDCELYRLPLSSWRVVRYRVQTRGGSSAVESLWMNYPEPDELHDYRYLGNDYRERERIKRLQARWIVRLSRMTTLERHALVSSLRAVRSQRTE
jgi:hypothetical protein